MVRDKFDDFMRSLFWKVDKEEIERASCRERV